MADKLFIIGNGFDRAHSLPTSFDPDFKKIARKYQSNNFWDIYQSKKDSIWSDFENLLGHPDFNCIEYIFDGYEPDYMSDRESDRDDIIYRGAADLKLQEALYEFANNAEAELLDVHANDFIKWFLDPKGYYITFNYTHTLEKIYKIPRNHILHIHGEVGENNLELGYSEGEFCPEKYSFDVRGKGRGPYIELDIEEYIRNIEDYYVRVAYESVFQRCKSLYKENKIDCLIEFLDKNSIEVKEIYVYGHSCAIDFNYFEYMNQRYLDVYWSFYVKDSRQEDDVCTLIDRCGIKWYDIVKI